MNGSFIHLKDEDSFLPQLRAGYHGHKVILTRRKSEENLCQRDNTEQKAKV